MRIWQWMVWALTALIVQGCPEPAESNLDNANPGSNNGTVGSNNGTAGSNNQTSNASNAGQNSLPGLEDVVIEVHPVEWGLFAGAPTAVAAGVDASLRDGRAVASIDLGPGAFRLEVQADSESVIAVGDATELLPLTGDLAAGPFFNPTRAVVEIEVWSEAGRWHAQARPRPEHASVAADSPAPAVGAGPWFEERFEAILGDADPGGRTVELMEEIRAHGGPLHTEAGVLFLAPAQDGEPAPQIRGTWNGFAADPAAELRRIAPGFWGRFIDVPAGPQEYKIFYPNGEAWVTDYSNPHVNWDGFDPQTVGSFNSVLGAQGARTVWWPQVASPELGNARDVYVHLPAAYDADATRRFPVLYVHDGNESIVRGQFHLVANDTAATDPASAAVIVFVALPDQTVRMQEYTMQTAGSRGDLYVEFLAQTLVPRVDATFRTRAERGARGLNGASLGGLISIWGAMQRPDVFGYAAGMSSSFFWGDEFMVAEIGNRGCQDVDYYLDSGSPDDNYEVTLRMRDALTQLGCRVNYVLDEGGQHDWSFWRERFDGMLLDFAQSHGG